MEDNLNIWNQVEETSPDNTKKFSRGGGFSGTAINPMYLIKKATSLWGAIGKGWGYTIVEDKFIEGAPLFINDERVCNEIVHAIKLELWFMDGDKKVTCPHQYGQTTFVGKNKYGLFTDEEAPKKTVTDALTKCLAALGFSADVYMGKYDDVKYINDIKQKQKNHHFKTTKERTELWNKIKEEIELSESVQDLNDIINGSRKGDLVKIKESDLCEELYTQLIDTASKHKQKLMQIKGEDNE